MHEWLDRVLLDRVYDLVGIVLVYLSHRFIRKLKGVKMLEGKEVDVAIGSIGHISLDINDKLEVELAVSAKVDLFAEVVKLAKKSNTQIDDAAAKILGSIFNRSAEEVLAAHAAAPAPVA